MRKTTLLTILVSAAVLCFSQDKRASADIEQVFDSFFRDYITSDPDATASLGNLDPLGYTFPTDRFTDYSEKAVAARYDVFRKYKSQLESFDRKKLSASQRMARQILLWEIDATLRGEKFKDYSYIPNQMDGIHNTLTTVMTEYHWVDNQQDAENYVARLESYSRRFDQELANLDVRVKMGILPPKYIFDVSEKEMSDFISVEPRNNVLYTSFVEKVGKLANVQQEGKEKLLRDAENSIGKSVYPAYRKFLARLGEIKAIAPDSAGVWQLPAGDEYYRYCLYGYTTTDLTPEEIYQTGLREVARIQQQAREILKSVGETEDKPFGELISQFFRKRIQQRDAQLLYTDTTNLRQRVLRDFQRIVDDVANRLPDYFSLIPKAPVIVERVPEYKEKTLPSNYSPGSLNGKRKGVFYVNLANPGMKAGMKTLTYHEAIPGHHFQIALQRESTVYRMFMSIFFNSGFVEGWALYAEKLAMENGWFENEYARLGFLNSELFRAIRLVVDVGIHYKHWTRDQALRYFRENIGWGSVLEVNRYIVTPGQACSYKIGELKIVELRQRARKELGKRFDLREFHRAILENGSVPLDLLERVVNSHIRVTREGTSTTGENQ